jgi:hypothetical protein
VSDDELHAIYAIPIAGGEPVELVHVARADLMTVLPDGSLVTSTQRGTLSRVTASGVETQLAGGFEHLRGMAYDPIDKRLFVNESSMSTSRHRLYVLSLDGGAP